MRSDGIFRIYSMTKPIVSVALMMLVEEGRLFISDPLAKFIPEFADPKVGVEKDGKLALVAAERPITIQDLLRHTSGLTYAFTGASAVQRLYGEALLRSRDIDGAGFVAALATFAADQPARRFLELQPFDRRRRTRRRDRLRPKPGRFSARAHPRAARHEGHRLFCAGGET